MTPEIEKATQECIKLKRDLTEAEQNYKLAQQAIEKPYKQTSEAIEKIHAQLNKLKEKEDELDEQLSKAHKKQHDLIESIESSWEYKTSQNYLINTQTKYHNAQVHLEQLIEEEAAK